MHRNICHFICQFAFIIVALAATMPACYAESVKSLDVHLDIDENKRVTATEDLMTDLAPTHTEPLVRIMPENQLNGEASANEIISGTKTMTIVDTTRDEKAHKVFLKISKPGVPPSGQHNYKIEYHSDHAITKDKDKAELVWNVTGDDWTMPIDKVTLFVSLPSAMNEEQVKVTATRGNASEKKDVKVEKGNMFIKCQTEMLYPGNNLTLRIALPKDSVKEGATPQEGPHFWETDWGRGIIGLCVMLAIGLIWCIWMAKREHM